MSPLQTTQHRRSEGRAGLTSTGDRRRKIETEALSIEMAQVHRAKAKEDFRSVLSAYQEYERHRDTSKEVELSGSQFFLLNLLLQSYEIWDAARLKEHEDLTVYLIEAYALVLHEISRGQTFLQKKLAKDHLVSANKTKSTWANVLRDVASNGTEELRAELLSLKKLENDPEAFAGQINDLNARSADLQFEFQQYLEGLPQKFDNLRRAVIRDSGDLSEHVFFFLLGAVTTFLTGGIGLSILGVVNVAAASLTVASGLQVISETREFSATGDLSTYDWYDNLPPEALDSIKILSIVAMLQLPVAIFESFVLWKGTANVLSTIGKKSQKKLRKGYMSQMRSTLKLLKGSRYAPAAGNMKMIERGTSLLGTGKMLYKDVYSQIKAGLEGDPDAKVDRVVGALIVLSLTRLNPTLKAYSKKQFKKARLFMKDSADIKWENPVSLSGISKSFYSTYKSISDLPKKTKAPIDDKNKW